jgi:hypothetical protein
MAKATIKNEQIEKSDKPDAISETAEKEILKPVKIDPMELLLKRMDILESNIKIQSEIISKQKEIISSHGNNTQVSGLSEFTKLIENLQVENSRKGNVKVTYLGNSIRASYKLSDGFKLTFKTSSESLNGFISKSPIYGQTSIISYDNAIRLLNEYTSAFESGSLMFDTEHIYMLEDKGINVSKINYSPIEDITNVHLLDEDGIESLYNGLQYHQREMLKAHIFGKIKGGETHYLSTDKLRLLNKLSKGSYKYVIDKLNEIEQY